MINENPLDKFKYKKHSGDMYVASITKEALENNDISAVVNTIQNARNTERKSIQTEIPLTENIKADKQVHASLVLHFQGYDEDSREMFEIPEVRPFYEKLLNEIPGLLYYLENTNILLLFYCLCTSRVENNQPVIDPGKLLDLLDKKLPETMSWIKNKFHKDDFKERIDTFLKILFDSSQQVPL